MGLKPQGNNILAGTSLAIAQIESPNFVTTVSGWIVRQDGSAEFNSVTIRGGVVIGGTSLQYSGTPAAGNLIGSDSSAASTDSFGNHYVAGKASYAATFATALNGGQVIWYTGTLAGGWTSVATATALATGTAGVIITGNGEVAIGNGTALISVGTAVGPGVVAMTGAFSDINAIHPGGGTVESWQAMSPLLNSWAAQAAPNVAPAYRKVSSPPNSVEVIGSLSAAAATAVTFFQLPAHYIPASSQPFHVGTFSGSAAIDNVTFGFCDTSGNLSIQQRIASATGIYFHGFISLDA